MDPERSEEYIQSILEDFDEEKEDNDEEDYLEKINISDDSDEDPDYLPSRSDIEIHVEKQIMEIEKEIRKMKKEKIIPIKKQKTKITERAVGSRETSESSSTLLELDEKHLFGRDGSLWDTKYDKTQKGKTNSKNIVHIRPGPTSNVDPEAETCFRLFLTDNIIDEIVVRTNEEIGKQREHYKVMCSTVRDTDKEEFMALVGLLIFSGAMNNNHLSAKLLFNSRYSGDVYLATMSRERFIFLINCLRFDNPKTRETRRAASKLAPIKDIWDMFIINCRKNYKSSSYCTIDEQLVGFRGRCPFRVYMGNKPNKYGIKIVMMCDNATKYMLHAIPYLGKGTTSEGQPVAEFFVENLVEDIKGSHRNITMDNWFVSVPLFRKLLKNYGLTAVGTIRKNKPQLPPEIVDIKYKNREVNSSLFIFSDQLSATSYKPRTNKLVTLLSTMHEGPSVNSSGKPEMIMTYNQTKGAVDTLDQMCNNMNCSRKTRRWPLCMFYNILNIAALNAYVIYGHQFFKRHPQAKNIDFNRRSFFIELQDKLCYQWRQQRAATPTLSRGLKTKIKQMVGGSEMPVDLPQPSKRKYCGLCEYSKRRYTTTYCCSCNLPICGEHQNKFCKNCTKK